MDHCANCPLAKVSQAGVKVVPGFGPKHPKVCVVGEAPGVNEASMGKPFVGRSGQLLRSALLKQGVKDSEVYFTNAVMCHPPGNATPTPTMWEACSERLFAELREVEPAKVLTVGGIALSALHRSKTPLPITKRHGQGETIDLGEGKSTFAVSAYHPAFILRDNDLYRDLAADLAKLVKQDGPFPMPDIQLEVCTTAGEVDEWLETLATASRISVDLETTGLSPIDNTVMSIGFGALKDDDSGLSVIIPHELVGNRLVMDVVQDFLEAYDGKIYFHNAKFDMQFIEVWLGCRLRLRHGNDTMLMRYAQDERPAGRDDSGRAYRTHGLKDLSRMRYDIPDFHFDFDKFFAQTEEERDYATLYKYQGLDCNSTVRLSGELESELAAESPALPKLVENVLWPATVALTEIELHGTLIDQPYFRQLGIEIGTKLEGQLARLKELAKSLAGIEDFNPNSHVQVKKVVFDKLKLKSKYGTVEREELLGMARTVDGDAKEFILTTAEYRQKSRELGTYVNGLLARVGPDGRIRSDFLLHGTATGRLSSRDPNLQNIPTLIGKEIRHGFTVPPGYLFVEADQSQLELRVAAWLSQDPALMGAFINGDDIHRLVAAKMFRKDPKDVTKFERYMAKYVDFGVLYGRGAKSLATGWEMEYLKDMGGTAWTIPEAEKFLQEFLNGFPKLKAWINTQHMLVRQRGFTETPLGRRRRFPLRMNDNIFAIERQCVNTPIQSFASDIVLTALTRLHFSLPEGAHILFTVHDSIAFEVREDLLDVVSAMIKYEMEENLPIPMNVPLKAEIKVGTRWESLG